MYMINVYNDFINVYNDAKQWYNAYDSKESFGEH